VDSAWVSPGEGDLQFRKVALGVLYHSTVQFAWPLSAA